MSDTGTVAGTVSRDVGAGPMSVPVRVIVVLHLFAALAFGVLAHIDPGNQFPDLVRNDDGSFAVGLYATGTSASPPRWRSRSCSAAD